ncbi:hypothetical protein WJ968_15255 [Achromobacter xylosoxidans]
MNYSDPDLQDRLAADYVAGVLRAGARRRFAGLLREDAALRQRVRDWEERLLPLALALPPQAPPEHVWTAIAARIRSRPESVPPAPPRAPPARMARLVLVAHAGRRPGRGHGGPGLPGVDAVHPA